MRDATDTTETAGHARILLAWYDVHARRMPWRTPPRPAPPVGPGDKNPSKDFANSLLQGIWPDPYRVWLSEVMLQQTTVAAVRSYFERFTALWPTVTALAEARDNVVMAEWAGLGYYARARNLLACARAVAARPGARFPETEAGLRALPGIGAYTAAAIAAIAFGIPATVVDGNVERVLARLFAVEEPLPKARPLLHALARSVTPDTRPGDYAQAMMDLGATVCTPRSPACGICPLLHRCEARARGLAADLPRKASKPARPTRQGILWVARRKDGAWLMERRPDRGLLGGTLGFPGTGWDGDAEPPVEATWRSGPRIGHTFTHFHLDAALRLAQVSDEAVPSRGAFHRPERLALTTLMRKALDAALAFPD